MYVFLQILLIGIVSVYTFESLELVTVGLLYL